MFIINLQSDICKVLAQLVKLRCHFPYYPFKKICLDNASEFTSYVFHEYCMSIGIEVEHLVEHMFMLKWTCKIMNKTVLLMKANLPMTTWRYAILHATILICIKPTSYHNYYIMQLVFG